MQVMWFKSQKKSYFTFKWNADCRPTFLDENEINKKDKTIDLEILQCENAA